VAPRPRHHLELGENLVGKNPAPNTFWQFSELEFLRPLADEIAVSDNSERDRMALRDREDRITVVVPSADAEHVALAETMTELRNALIKGDGRNLSGPLLRSLLAYARNHFSREQTRLTQTIEALFARFERGEIALNLQLLHALDDWYANHIQKVDRNCRPWLLEHPAH
jgi:hemerythrin